MPSEKSPPVLDHPRNLDLDWRDSVQIFDRRTRCRCWSFSLVEAAERSIGAESASSAYAQTLQEGIKTTVFASSMLSPSSSSSTQSRKLHRLDSLLIGSTTAQHAVHHNCCYHAGFHCLGQSFHSVRRHQLRWQQPRRDSQQ